MLTWVLAAAAAACLIYYGIIIVYAGLGAASAFLWLFMGLFFGASAAGVYFYQKYPERLPLWLPVALVTLSASGALLIFAMVILIFGRIPAAAEPELDYVIVLGASVKPEGPSKTLKLRLDKAAEYAAQNPETMFILTGGQGADEPETEAEAMRDYLVKQGIPAGRLLLEKQAKNTVENITYSRAMIEKREGRRQANIGILTSNFHLVRARLIAAHQGLSHIRGIASEADPILLIHFSVRDSIAILKDRLLGNL